MKKRIISIVVVVVLMICVAGFTVFASNENMIYVSAKTGSSANNGLTVDKPVDTLENAYKLIPDSESGTIILCDDYTIEGVYSFPVHTGKITIKGMTPSVTLHGNHTDKIYWDCLSPIELIT